MYMKKVYLIGVLYDDYRDKGFEVKTTASSKEMALAIKTQLEMEGMESNTIQIREWELDIVNPIGKIQKTQGYIKKDGIEIITHHNNIIPYKIIK